MTTQGLELAGELVEQTEQSIGASIGRVEGAGSKGSQRGPKSSLDFYSAMMKLKADK